MNKNLATYSSGYVAPRTTVAEAKEAVENATKSTPKPQPVQTEPEEVPGDMPDFTGADVNIPEDNSTSVSTDDDDWINSVLNS